jgi:hypothetical protein
MGDGEFANNPSPTPKRAGPLILQELVSVCPAVVAGLLLAARSCFVHLDLPAPDVARILAATKASRSSAYETMASLAELLPTLARPRGRPPKPTQVASSSSSADAATLTRAVLAYVMRHPGCVHRDRVRQTYSDGFRHFILEQHEKHTALDVEVFAAAIEVPLGTLKDWLRVPPTAPSAPSPAPSPSPSESPAAESLHIQTVLDAWPRWEGTFIDFCEHARRDLHVPFGRMLVAYVLDAHGVRHQTRRHGRSSNEIASRGSFITFFPGAQWVGDGMQVPVVVDGQRFTINFELDVDAHTGAFVGLSVRDEEDSAAVIEAFDSGVATTGAPPLALLLDNKPSNHTSDVDAAMGDTLRIRATIERPQNKAHVEGAFGLFSCALPDLVLDTRRGPRALAGAFARIVAELWARTMNRRPRADRDGRSRVELYADTPSTEQIEDARRQLREIAEKQERARRTLQARRRPEVLALLDDHFTRLGLLDPERHVRIAIAAYPLNAIVAGIAIFDGKKRAATLPEGADARYLLGIVRNVAHKAEGEHAARAMLALRLEVRDRMLAPLRAARDVICASSDAARVSADCIDHALATESPLDRVFWLDALADFLTLRSRDEQRDRFLDAARRIHATFAVTIRERHDAVRVLAERLLPVT